MSEKSIIFNAVEVRAILEGRKFQTRRPVKPQPKEGYFISGCPYVKSGWSLWEHGTLPGKIPHNGCRCVEVPCPYRTGDILWVRETWERLDCGSCEGNFANKCQREPDEKSGCYMYRATHYITGDARWKPSVHMPREAARIFLKVTDVSVGRVQDITEEDARAEGFANTGAFREYWDTLSMKQRGADWYTNEWVWVISFERVNI